MIANVGASMNRDLRVIVRDLAVVGSIAAGVALASAALASVADNPDPAAVQTACSVAVTSLDQSGQEAARTAIRILSAAGVSAENSHILTGECDEAWRAAGARAAGLRLGLLGPACANAAAALRDGETDEALAALTAARVTAGNHRWLSRDCRTTWLIAEASTGRSPSAGIDAQLATEACALARRQLSRGDEVGAIATLSAAGEAAGADAGGCSATWALAAALQPAAVEETGPQQVGRLWDTTRS
jgi:hypothetical protein